MGIDTYSRGKQNLFGYQFNHTENFSRRFRQVTTVSFATNNLFYRSGWGDSHSDNFRAIVNTRSEITISSTNSLAAGFEFNREEIKNSYITDAEFSPFLLPRTSYAYFVEDRWNPTSRLYLIAGIRFDNLRTGALPPDAWGSRPAIPATSVLKVNPRASIAYILRDSGSGEFFEGTRIHGSFGTGIRPPDGFELAFTDNPALKPERSVSFDAGVEQRMLTSRAVLDVTYFFNRFSDQIVSLGGDLSNLSRFSSDNLKNTSAHGVEISFRLRPVQSLELGAQYTFLDSSILALDGSDGAKDPFEVGQPLIRRPRHSGSYSVTWRYKRLTLNTSAYVRGEALDVDPTFGLSACSYGMPCFFQNPGHIRADAGFSYRMPRGIELFARVNNFLNQKYEEVFGYPALGANFHAGMKFSFPSE
jgi:outer membrane receptor protein involved in Fe transport